MNEPDEKSENLHHALAAGLEMAQEVKDLEERLAVARVAALEEAKQAIAAAFEVDEDVSAIEVIERLLQEAM